MRPKQAKKIRKFALLLFSAGACLTQGAFALQCLSYEPVVVSITGTLVRETFPGPPNYESVRRGDRPETDWLIDLQNPVCVNEDKVNPDLNPKRQGIRRVQLVLDPKAYEVYRPLLGKNIVASGTLFGAISGHHHTPVLLVAKDLAAAHKKQPRVQK